MMGIKRIFAFLAAVLLCSGFCAASGAEVVLVDDGRAACTVVTGEDDGLSMTFVLERSNVTRSIPSRVLEYAAADLAEYLNEVGWIGEPRFEVEVVDDIKKAGTPYRILLGTAAIAEYGLEEEAAGLSYPGYIYRTVGNDLLIFGATSKGTANGVYGFLQDELGVRWFGPQELFTIAPRQDRVAVSGLDRKVEPSFTGHFGINTRADLPDHPWIRRMRLAERGDCIVNRTLEPFSAPSHNVGRVVSFRDYYETNPEYFRMQGGERRLHSNPGHTNLCWTNREVIEITAEAARERFRRGEYYHMFSVGIMDSDAYCECPDCEAIQPERYYRGRSRAPQRVASDQYFYFVNEVAGRVKDEFPDRYLGLIAYNDVSVPPEGDIEDNVFVSIVLDISEHYDERVRKADRELIGAWEEKGVELGMYYYIGLAKLVPAYFPEHLSETLKDIHARGFRGLRSEAYPGWPWTGPMVYADARLWWDAELDIAEVLDEYFRMLYGPAAPYMSRLYGLFEEIHMRPRTGGFLYEHYNFAQFRPYTRGDLEKMKELVASSHAAIRRLGTNWVGRINAAERRLAHTTNGLRLFFDLLEGIVTARELEDMDAGTGDVDIIRAVTKVQRINELIDRHEQVYREAIIKDPYHSNRYTVDTCTPVRVQWKEYLSRVAGEALVGIYNGIREAGAEPESYVREMLEAAAADYCRRDISSEALFRLGMGEWSLEEPNLIRNPGFEDVEGVHPDYPAHLEWQRAGADNWAYWQRTEMGEFTVSEDVKRSGARSGAMRGVGSGVLLGLGPGAEPGEYYYFEAYVKNLTEPEDGTEVRVMLDWLDSDDRWVRERFTRRVEGFDEWVRVDAVVRAPETAASAVVLFSTGGLPHGSSVHFDDVTFKKIRAGDY